METPPVAKPKCSNCGSDDGFSTHFITGHCAAHVVACKSCGHVIGVLPKPEK